MVEMTGRKVLSTTHNGTCDVRQESSRCIGLASVPAEDYDGVKYVDL